MAKKQKQPKIPGITLHKATGQGRVRLSGRDFYLGEYGSAAANEAYHRLVGEWLANGRSIPNQPKRKARHTTNPVPDDSEGEVLTVRELVERYLVWARARYTHSDRAVNCKYAAAPLVDAYGSLPACEFSPNKLRAVRALMIEKGWVRTNINRKISTIKGIFGWAVGRELLPETVHAALCRVESLVYGHDVVAESPEKGLVSDETIEAIRPYLSSQVYGLLQLAMLSGARMGELVQITPGLLNPVEVDGVGILEFSPPHYKTKHRGASRVIRFGPRSAMILQPFLNRPDDLPCFSPREAEQDRRRQLHLARVTPPTYGNTIGTNRKDNPQWKPGNCYSTCSVRKAIRRAVNTYNKYHPDDLVEMFTPHRLRHSALTKIRDEYGFEAAMGAAGHRSGDMTQLYTERSSAAGRRLAVAAG